MKSFGNTDINGTKKNVRDVVVFGDGDMFKLMCKASSEEQGWMKSTKACDVGTGCIVQVTTQQRNPDGSYAIAEALTFVPGVRIVEVFDGAGAPTSRAFERIEPRLEMEPPIDLSHPNRRLRTTNY